MHPLATRMSHIDCNLYKWHTSGVDLIEREDWRDTVVKSIQLDAGLIKLISITSTRLYASYDIGA